MEFIVKAIFRLFVILFVGIWSVTLAMVWELLCLVPMWVYIIIGILVVIHIIREFF